MIKKTILFGLSLMMAISAYSQLSDQIRLTSGSYTPEENVSEFISTATLSKKDVVAEKYYRLIQFNAIPTLAEIKSMKKLGIELLTYIPNKAYIASLPTTLNPDQLRSINVRHISETPLDMRISEQLRSANIPEWAKKNNDQIEISLTYYKDLNQEDVLELCRQDGISPMEFNGINNQIIARIPESLISRLGDLPYVSRVDFGPEPDRPDDRRGKALARANILDSNLPSGRHYNGSGISVLTRDDGDVGPHIDFQGRITQDIIGSPNSTHADLVSGVMCGAANLNPRNQGMATNADLYVINYRASFLDNTLELHRDEDVLVTNSSYSNGCNRGYTNISQTVDDQCYENLTLMHVFSAGNDGQTDCNYGAGGNWGNITGGHKQGKNVITVGSSDNMGAIAASSSRGPATDGRIKPDITAHGQAHVSTLPDNNYTSTSGTSFSAPLVAGVMAMLHQAYRDNNAGEIAEAALLKTIMLNTANDYGNPGPDFIFGWGSVNAYRAALAIEENRFSKHTIAGGEFADHVIPVPDNVQELKVMVYWQDPSANPNSDIALINDINSNLTAIDGSIGEPWVLNPTPNASTLDLPATKGVDALNNMEQISIANPSPGDYTLNVHGTVIPFGTSEYFITWEYLTTDVQITYPAGGEKFVAGEDEIIHWDAINTGERATVQLSVDGGLNWEMVGNQGTDINLDQIRIPDATTNNALIRITRGTSTSTSEPFTISPIPTQFQVIRLCQEVVYEWESVEGAISYDVFRLGERFMETVMTTAETTASFPFRNCTEVDWYAVSANFADGTKSQRTNAVSTGIDLIDCDLPQEIELTEIITPTNNYIVCEGPVTEFPVFDITNNGIDPISNFEVTYLVNNTVMVTETITESIEPDSTLRYTFSESYFLDENGFFTMEAWISSPDEFYICNDTLRVEAPVYFDKGEPLPFSEDFNNLRAFPEFWRTASEDNITWDIQNVTQRNNQDSDVARMGFGGYSLNRAVDGLQMIPLDFSNASAPIALTFDMAYSNNDDDDGLRIIVSSDCGQSYADTLFFAEGRDLKTSFGSFVFPDQDTDWDQKQIDLSAYAGNDMVVIQFQGINSGGSDLFIDNINVSEIQEEAPVSNFSVVGDVFCQNEKMTIIDNSDGSFLDYAWNFGFGGTPVTANYEGPHALSYLFSGSKEIKLTVTNALGSDESTRTVEIIEVPLGGWEHDEVGAAQVAFTSNFQFEGTYQWDFGDGGFSNQKNPTHQFPGPGTYNVALTATNRCGSKTLSSNIIVETSDVTEIDSDFNIQLFPNPNTGQFSISVAAPQNDVTMTLFNLEGQTVWTKRKANIDDTENIDINDLTPGIYLMTLKSTKGMSTQKVIIN